MHFESSGVTMSAQRQGPLSHNAIHKIVVRAGEVAGLKIPAHAHMLRHGEGFDLAVRGVGTRIIQAYFGHRNIQHTVRYTQLDARRFKGFGKDLKF